MPAFYRCVLGALALSVVAAPVLAQESAVPDLERSHVPLGKSGILGLTGSLRLIGGFVTQPDVLPADTAVPTVAPRDDFGYLRLRFGPEVAFLADGFFRLYKLAAEAELRWFPWGYQRPMEYGVDPRYELRGEAPDGDLLTAYALVGGSSLAIRAGLVRSDFGLGLVSNGGRDAPAGEVRQSPFGYGREGDRNLELQIALRPLAARLDEEGQEYQPLTVVTAAQAVIHDDRSDWEAGDRTLQVLAGVLARYDWFRAALGAVYRYQDHLEGGLTEVLIGVVQAGLETDAGPVRLWLEGELAAYLGTSSLLQSAIDPGPYDVSAVGGVLRAGVTHEELEVALEGGAATGDDNPFDKELHTFSFDREYRVGLLMFSEALAASTAITAYNVSDPTYREEAPRGYQRTATGGAVQNAIYLNPRVAWRPFDGFAVLAGYLYAASEEAWVDPFQSGLAGGAAVAPRGARDVHELGHEVDLGVSYELALSPLTLSAHAQYGWFRPGAVFADASGVAARDLHGFWFHLEGRW
jgi:hypothetical protein